ncbi:hypothetical protein M3194_30430 [Paenibacillus glycanilyticus]|uniref:hypothetical protein n=1 Tax=Paenibacillus glycanilyticus TaxID=126569 RepID=UPI00203C628A|nr:hypothetical protein [Paenibacillus glycanilyticus]MCM3631616.1 hypothetical protein [Paenibacillus glycanilyticus]
MGGVAGENGSMTAAVSFVLSKNGGSLLLRMMSERPGNLIERAYRHLLAETKKLLAGDHRTPIRGTVVAAVRAL